jgi:CHAT domain-containing protein
MITKKNQNPFIVGDWIKRDQDFFGRSELIEKYLALNRHYYWLIGARRMGKTSLLRYLQRQYRKGKGLLPLFWDVAGANSAYDLKLSFLDCLEAGIADFERNGIEPDIEKLEHESILTIFRWLIRECEKCDTKIILLIDESEALFQVAVTDARFLNRFKAMLFNHQTVHIILASNHGLAHYDTLATAHFTAPFLQAFLPPDYLMPWHHEEALSFLKRCTTDRDEQNRIKTVTGCLPFLVQMVCFYYFDLGDLDQALNKIDHDNIIDLFFRNDFQNFDRNDSAILATIAENEPFSFDQIQGMAGKNFNQLEQRLSTLTWLGFLAKNEQQNYGLNNQFLRNWMKQNYRPALQGETFNQIKRHADDIRMLVIEIADDSMNFRLLENSEILIEQQIRTTLDPARYIQPGTPDLQSIKQIGQQLFYDLFGSTTAQQIYQDFASGNNDSELVIRNKQNQAGAIPFEALHNGQQFLVLRHPLYRARSSGEHYLADTNSIQQPLKILLIASDTPPAIPLVENEIMLIKNQLQKIARELQVEIEITSILSAESDYVNVMNLIHSGQFQFIHFAGHSSADQNCIYLWDKPKKSGRVKAVSADELSGRLNSTLRFFYLNGCNSAGITNSSSLAGFAEAILSTGATAFVGNGRAVEDRASAEFAMDFYWQLFENQLNFARAMYLTRLKWSQQTQFQEGGHLFWLSPVLWR